MPAELTSARHEHVREGRPVTDGAWAPGSSATTQSAAADKGVEGDGDIYLSSIRRNAEELAQQCPGALTRATARAETADDDTRDTRGLKDTVATAAARARSESKGGVDHQQLVSDTADGRDTMPELELVAGAEVDLTELD